MQINWANRMIGIIWMITMAAWLTVGCESEQPSEVGSIQVPLTGEGDSGALYRLRHGAFRVRGAENATLLTENHLGESAIARELSEGAYIVNLLPGWRLEKEVGGIFEPIDAVLVSDNPQGFSIEDQLITTVVFRFKAGEDVVDLGNGILEIVISVDDDDCTPPTWSEETDQVLEDGAIVPNWSLDGYVDVDGDGVVEETAATFSLEDKLCSGVHRLVFTHCDLTCAPCEDFLTELATVEEGINAAGGAILAVVTNGWDDMPVGEAQTYLNTYGIEGRYISGELPDFRSEFVPLITVIDLTTAQVLRANDVGTHLTAEDILDIVENGL